MNNTNKTGLLCSATPKYKFDCHIDAYRNSKGDVIGFKTLTPKQQVQATAFNNAYTSAVNTLVAAAKQGDTVSVPVGGKNFSATFGLSTGSSADGFYLASAT